MSPFGQLIAATSLLLATGLLTILIRGIRNPLSHVPGPWHTKFTRLGLKLAVLTCHRAYYIHDLHKKYGPYVRVSPTEVAVSGAEGFAQIHRIGTRFLKSSWYHQFTAGEPRLSMFTMINSKDHAARRRMFSRSFSQAFLLENWHDTVKSMCHYATHRMREAAASNGEQIDVLEWWTYLTMDVSGVLMYGHSFKNLERGTISDVLRLVTESVKIRAIGAELPIVSAVTNMFNLLPSALTPEFFTRGNALQEYGKKYLESVKSSETSSNIFSSIAQEAEVGEKLDEEDLQVEAAGLIIAGTDTTAVTLTYLVYSVLSRPDLQAELEKEVATLPDNFTDVDAKGVPLLNAIISETLRLHTAAPSSLPRVVPPSGASMGGISLPPGTMVSTQSYSFHRDPELFPRPYEFLPSRWLNDEVSPEAKRLYHPLGAGSRICIGMHLAYMELRLASAHFFRNCKDARLAPSTTEQSMEMEIPFLVAPRGGKCDIIIPGKTA